MCDWPNVDIQKLRANLTHNLPVLRSPRTETALDRYLEELVKALQLAIDQAIPLKRWSPRARAGWTLECKELQAEAQLGGLQKSPKRKMKSHPTGATSGPSGTSRKSYRESGKYVETSKVGKK
ncbi:hypothetical protein BELL_1540g00020 [Botrytis elliptica]|uniref:Uncharacterized protein n=1 Tax=Botrytis elliptica TaxID=278938 RepID=A0A4Z1HYF9_9HELO|nr:hypothetical protein BELL_1540g00020 [Botrytis elliptica]